MSNSQNQTVRPKLQAVRKHIRHVKVSSKILDPEVPDLFIKIKNSVKEDKHQKAAGKILGKEY